MYEDLRKRDGAVTFISSQGLAGVLTRKAEETFTSEGPHYLGLAIKDWRYGSDQPEWPASF